MSDRRDAAVPWVVRVRLDELLSIRGMTLTELSQLVGITVANLSILKTGKAKAVRFSTLVALCSALQCQPGDLLVVVPASEESGPAAEGR